MPSRHFQQLNSMFSYFKKYLRKNKKYWKKNGESKLFTSLGKRNLLRNFSPRLIDGVVEASIGGYTGDVITTALRKGLFSPGVGDAGKKNFLFTDSKDQRDALSDGSLILYLSVLKAK